MPACVYGSLSLSHKWVMVWSQTLVLLWPWSLACQRPTASLCLPHGEASALGWDGGLPWLSQFILLHGRALCPGFEIPGYVWLLWRIVWEPGLCVCVCVCVCECLCVCLCVSPLIPERCDVINRDRYKCPTFWDSMNWYTIVMGEPVCVCATGKPHLRIRPASESWPGISH